MDKASKNACPVPNGMLLVIGGHENKGERLSDKLKQGNERRLEILEAFIKLTGKADPVIEVVTTASSEGDESFKDYEKAFSQLNLKELGHIHHNKRSEILDSDLTDRIRKADGIFFSGGDQLKLTAIYGGTSFLYELKRRYVYEHLVLGGTSAGAMAFSTPMIYAGNKNVQQIAGEIRVTTGLEFLKNVCIDTHFVDRARFVRMSQVIASNPSCIGVGIEEDTALIIRNGVEAEVIGSGVVVTIEGFGITDSNILNFESGERIFVEGLTVKVLPRGRTYTIPKYDAPHL